MVAESDVKRLVTEGFDTATKVCRKTGAGSDCGICYRSICEFVRKIRDERKREDDVRKGTGESAE